MRRCAGVMSSTLFGRTPKDPSFSNLASSAGRVLSLKLKDEDPDLALDSLVVVVREKLLFLFLLFDFFCLGGSCPINSAVSVDAVSVESRWGSLEYGLLPSATDACDQCWAQELMVVSMD